MREDLSLRFQVKENVDCAGMVQDLQVVSIGVEEKAFNPVGSETFQRSLYALANGSRGKVKDGFSVDEVFTRLGHDDPLVSTRAEERSESLFARAVGRSGIKEVDSLFHREIHEKSEILVAGEVEALWVFDLLIATQLDGAETETRNFEWSVVKRSTLHGFCQGRSHGAVPTSGEGISSLSGWGCFGTFIWART